MCEEVGLISFYKFKEQTDALQNSCQLKMYEHFSQLGRQFGESCVAIVLTDDLL